jgi:hypothetical protein
MRESNSGATLENMKMLIVDITAPGSAGGRLGRYKVSERRQDGSLVLVPESMEEVVSETAGMPLDGDEFLDARGILSASWLMTPTYELEPGFAREFARLLASNSALFVERS